MYLTPEAENKLSATIRGLCKRLLTDLHDRATSLYRLDLPITKAGLAEEFRKKQERLEAWLEEHLNVLMHWVPRRG